MKIGIIDLCKQIEDPRMNRKKVHKMEIITGIKPSDMLNAEESIPL